MTHTDTAPFALLSDDLTTVIEEIDCDDAKRDRLAKRYGRRFVYAPQSYLGDTVEIDEDGKATTIDTDTSYGY